MSNTTETYQIPDDILLTKEEKNNLMRLIESIHEVTEVQPELYMASRTQKSKHTHLRQIAAYIIRNNTKLTLREIGIIQGYRDHSSIIHSIKQVEAWMDGTPGFAFEKNITQQILKSYGEKCQTIV